MNWNWKSLRNSYFHVLNMKCQYCEAKGYPSEVFISSSGNLCRCLTCDRDVEVKIVRTPIKLEKKGKVVICTIHGRTILEGVDKQLFAVGKPKGRTYFEWWEHTPGLAPTRDLVTFTKEHNRKGRLEGWFESYEESLLDEWETSSDSMKSFTQLLKWLNKGLNVGIACYCAPEKRPVCHLSILRGLLEDLGYVVEEAEPIKYKS